MVQSEDVDDVVQQSVDDMAVAFERENPSRRLAFAARADYGNRYVLVWSRKEEIWCYPDGSSGVVTMKVGEAAGPFTRLRGRGNRGFIFG
jgi:hypothetical protein